MMVTLRGNYYWPLPSLSQSSLLLLSSPHSHSIRAYRGTAQQAINMRIPFLTASFPFALLPFATARSSQQPLQVYLYPAPQSSLTYQQLTPPTLSYTQAKAVLDHHLRQAPSAFDDIPEDENMWVHLLPLWDSREVGKARVVVVDGGVEAQGKRCSWNLLHELMYHI